MTANHDILNGINQVLVNQHALSAQQSSQIADMQEQLKTLTEVAQKLVLIEERRQHDNERLHILEAKMDTVKEAIASKFPQYDNVVDVFKTINTKLLVAIGTGAIGLMLAAAKLVTQ